ASVSLNSRLASASAAAVPTFPKASVTPLCPAVNATPLARKPTTGTSASPMMRVRTEMEAIDWANDWSMHAFQGKRPSQRPTGWRLSELVAVRQYGRVHQMVKQVANRNLRIIHVKFGVVGTGRVREQACPEPHEGTTR